MPEYNLFLLKHENDIVASLHIDLMDGSIRKVKIENEELLPPGGNLSTEELRRWWIRRAVPQLRGNIKKVLEESGTINTQSLLLQNLGISLSDHYWICPADYSLLWEQINPYENDFRDTIGEIQFRPSSQFDYNGSSFVPGASLQGELKKKWVIGDDGDRYLIKGNYGLSFQQSINEVIATKIHEKQNKMPYTTYDLIQIELDEEQALGCICRNFANKNVEFIPAYDVVSSVKKRNDLSEYESFIAICGINGLDKEYVRSYLEYQILTDFIITNTDRHFNNFGVLRDVKTLKYIDIAPIFDSGNSMLWNRRFLPEKEKIKSSLFSVPVTSFKNSEPELLKYIRDFSAVDLSKLPSDQLIMDLLDKDNMESKRVENLMNWFHAKVDVIQELQLGKKLENVAERNYIKKPRISR